MRMAAILPSFVALTGCFYGNEFNFPGRDDMVEAAARCGVPSFQPTDVQEGVVFEAIVPENVPDAQKKEDCIYADLRRQGFDV